MLFRLGMNSLRNGGNVRETQTEKHLKVSISDLTWGLGVKNLPTNAGDTCSIPISGRSHRLQGN